MTILCPIFFSSLLEPAFANTTTYKTQVFGVDFRFESPSPSIVLQTEKTVKTLGDSLGESWDPDCLWRKKSAGGACPTPKDANSLASVSALAETFKAETNGYFEVMNPKGQRDFSGLSQGLFIDLLRAELKKKPAVYDFAGDIFFEKGATPTRKFQIQDTINPLAKFAEVKMKSGWMLGGFLPADHTQIWNPKTKEKWTPDFQQIVLFAESSFSGARLDAWETALLPGGKKLLAELEASKAPGKSRWAYFYFDLEGKPVCSKNIRCDFKNPAKRTITLPW